MDRRICDMGNDIRRSYERPCALQHDERNDVSGGRMMVSLRDLIGKPYAIHGRGPDAYDCYGLAIEVCSRLGLHLEDAFYDELGNGVEERLIDETKASIQAIKVDVPGLGVIVELKIAGEPRHIGVCLGDGTFIHATQKIGVRTSELSAWSKRIEGYYTWQQ